MQKCFQPIWSNLILSICSNRILPTWSNQIRSTWIKIVTLLLIPFLPVAMLLGCDKPDDLYPVVSVVDGDTIKVDCKGSIETVRLIGVNTPETKHPTKGVEPYGPEASAYTKKLLKDSSVRLEFDVQQRDKYGRLLAYVYLEDGTFINEQLICDGYAQVMTVPPNVKFAERFVELQRKAREAEMGLWGQDGAASVDNGRFVGSAKSDKYHLPDCQWAKKITQSNMLWFKDGEDAKNKGYIPCKVCSPY